MNNFEQDVFESGLIKRIPELLERVYEKAESRPLFENDNLLNNILRSELPEIPLSVAEIEKEILGLLMTYECNVLSPKYFGYITPRPLPISIIGDWLALLGNQCPGARRAGPLAAKVEDIVVNWIAQFAGIRYKKKNVPPGIITSGGSMSNLTGLHLGREQAQKRGQSLVNLRYYVCENAHLSIFRALNILGATEQNICIVPMNDEQCMDIESLYSMVENDCEQGYYPAVVVGTYGSTSVGAIDKIWQINSISKKYNMWFHIDAASGGVFGGEGKFVEKNGALDLGDSVAIDPSKWLFVSYGVSCLLVKNAELLYELYSTEADYWKNAEEVDNFQMSFTCTRSWRTLGIYMAFCHMGKEGYRRQLTKLCSIADILQEELQKIGCIVIRGSDLPIIAFSLPNNLAYRSEELISNAISKNIAYMTLAQLNNETYIRIAISNYDTKISDIITLTEYIKKFIERK